MRWLTALLVFAAPLSMAAILPPQPPEGLRITVSINCDFQQHWWEATFYPDPAAALPLEIRWRTPRMRDGQARTVERPLNPGQRERLYTASRAAFDDFRLDRRPPLIADEATGPWLGPRTLTLSALILDAVLGRVDRIDLALDLLPGRSLGAVVDELIATLAEHGNPINRDLDCR